MNTANTTKSDFEDVKINIKIKLAALWTSLMFCYLYGDYFELYVPLKTQGLVNGVNLLNSPVKLFAAAVFLAIPALMVFLSLVVKPAINRRINIVLGIFFTLVMVSLATISFSPWYSFYVFLAIAESCITICIVKYAWQWPEATALN